MLTTCRQILQRSGHLKRSVRTWRKGGAQQGGLRTSFAAWRSRTKERKLSEDILAPCMRNGRGVANYSQAIQDGSGQAASRVAVEDDVSDVRRHKDTTAQRQAENVLVRRNAAAKESAQHS